MLSKIAFFDPANGDMKSPNPLSIIGNNTLQMSYREGYFGVTCELPKSISTSSQNKNYKSQQHISAVKLSEGS